MDLVALAKLGGTFKTLALDSPVDDFLPFGELLGVKREHLEPLVELMRVHSPDEKSKLVVNFLKDGSFMRMLAKPDQVEGKPEPYLMNCPHCKELVIL